jgi:hypothetical protein
MKQFRNLGKLILVKQVSVLLQNIYKINLFLVEIVDLVLPNKLTNFGRSAGS